MKTFYTICLIPFLIITLNLFAQPYQILKSNQEALFLEESNLSGNKNVFAVKIDSTQMAQNDSILFTNRNFYENEPNCYIPLGSSILGYNFIIKNNAYNYIVNKNYDTLKIKTNALLNETWLAFQIEDSISITAKVDSIYNLSFLEIEDSIKSISFEVLDSAGNILAHYLNDNNMRLSKNYGFQTTFDLREFPNVSKKLTLLGLSNPRIGHQNLTMFEVHNFDVGDEIHTNNYYASDSNTAGDFIRTTLSRKTYLGRTNYLDSIVYSVLLNQYKTVRYVTNNTMDSTISTYFEDTIKEKITPYNEFDVLPLSPIYSNYSDSSYYYLYDLFWNENSNRLLKTDSGFDICNENNYGYETTCWFPFCFTGGSSYATTSYIEGLGGGYYDALYWNFDNPIYSNHLVYYKKGNETSGNPLTFTNLQESNYEHLDFKIFPNPVQAILNISFENQSANSSIKIYNLKGVLIINEQLNLNSNQLNLEKLNAGIYVYEIILDGNKLAKTGKLLKE